MQGIASGEYKCIAGNGFGSDNASFEITREGMSLWLITEQCLNCHYSTAIYIEVKLNLRMLLCEHKQVLDRPLSCATICVTELMGGIIVHWCNILILIKHLYQFQEDEYID